jgi:GTP-binding protein
MCCHVASRSRLAWLSCGGGVPMSTPVFSPDELEAGRKLFASNWDFAFAVSEAEKLPPGHGVEIAFAGRSNIGKSSLINALTGRKALARTSNTPGRTQELIFFRGPADLMLVDMPGYGYAQAPKAKVAAWTDLISAYLKGRANLARAYVLIDARHGMKPVDGGVLDSLDQAALSYQIVLTKCDLISAAELAQRITETKTALSKHPAAFPELAAVSARTGAGIPELRGAIARLLTERVE